MEKINSAINLGGFFKEDSVVEELTPEEKAKVEEEKWIKEEEKKLKEE